MLESKAIGAGILLANGLIVQHHNYNQTLDEAASIAVYILAKVKRQVDTCGGNTDLIVLENSGNLAFTKKEEIERLEKKFKKIESAMNQKLTKGIVRSNLAFSWLR